CAGRPSRPACCAAHVREPGRSRLTRRTSTCDRSAGWSADQLMSMPTATNAIAPQRVEQITAATRRLGAGAAVLTSPANLRWLGLIDPAGTCVVISAGAAIAVVPANAGAPGGA